MVSASSTRLLRRRVGVRALAELLEGTSQPGRIRVVQESGVSFAGICIEIVDGGAAVDGGDHFSGTSDERLIGVSGTALRVQGIE